MGVVVISDSERRRILDGNYPTMFREQEPDAGTLQLDRDVWLTVEGGTRVRGKGWRLKYQVKDFRPRLLKDSPFAGITRYPALALRHEGEAVDEEYQDRITAESGTIHAIKEQARLASLIDGPLGHTLEQTIQQAKRQGIDTSSIEHVVQRQVGRLKRRLERAA